MVSQSGPGYGRQERPDVAAGGDPRDPLATAQYRTVGSYDNYADAERAVDHLSDQRFPVERVAIVGRGLATVEQVTGRLTYWVAAGRYAVSGAIIGALLGWIFGLFDLVDPLVASLWLALWGAVFGAVVGAILGLVTHAMTGGRRDFSSIDSVRADRYDVQVDAAFADEAARVLGGTGGAGTPPAPGRI
jgi:hypothetical protein